jgi:hypothetical protein
MIFPTMEWFEDRNLKKDTFEWMTLGPVLTPILEKKSEDLGFYAGPNDQQHMQP